MDVDRILTYTKIKLDAIFFLMLNSIKEQKIKILSKIITCIVGLIEKKKYHNMDRIFFFYNFILGRFLCVFSVDWIVDHLNMARVSIEMNIFSINIYNYFIEKK